MAKAVQNSTDSFVLKPGDYVVPHDEAAKRMGCTAKALYDRCYDGNGPKHVVRLVGRRRGYLNSEIEELIASSLVREGGIK